jgi:hypothetical protein
MIRKFCVLCGALMAAAALSAQTPPAGAKDEGVIDPKADKALQDMSTWLKCQKSFKVETTAVDEKVTNDGQKIQVLNQAEVTVMRPGHLRVDRVGPNGHATLRTDGRQVAVFNSDKQVYSSAPAPATIDAQLDMLRQRLGIDAPGEQLIVSNPYAELTEGLKEAHYVGLVPINGVMAHHIAVREAGTDWQIWIAAGAEAKPLRMVVTSTDIPSHPQYTLELNHWQPNVATSSETFELPPPPGARKVDFAAPREQQH